MSLKFDDSDFPKEFFASHVNLHNAKEFAQKAFDKWLSEQPVVYTCRPEHPQSLWNKIEDGMTHQARLVNIEPIKKCEHYPLVGGIFDRACVDAIKFICSSCGKQVKPKTWEEA